MLASIIILEDISVLSVDNYAVEMWQQQCLPSCVPESTDIY